MARHEGTGKYRAVRREGTGKHRATRREGTGKHRTQRGRRRPDSEAIGWKEAKESKAEWEHELGVAAEVQACLLPSKKPQLPGYDLYSYYRPAKEVGGDYYDFFPIDNERLGIVIADVSGKGIPGAMVMAATRTLLRVLGPQCGSPAETFRQANYYVSRDVARGMFVTAILAMLNVRTGEMTMCSAGHNPAVVYLERKGACRLWNPEGIALGFDKGPTFDRVLRESKLQFEPGDRVVMYTDGVVEAMNSRNQQYGEARFYRFVLDHARMSSKEFVWELVRDLEEHTGRADQYDDITIVTLRLEE